MFSISISLTRGGSSPRMWGTRPQGAGRGLFARFIPTHVGNSQHSASVRFPCTVHPHACGELSAISSAIASRLGSSPRMWGTPSLGNDNHGPVRFIPTHVGNSQHSASVRFPCTVHPHACGELAPRHRPPMPPGGSSPRMWGTLPRRQPVRRPGRFIPTHVGNSHFLVSHPQKIAVHPHACGELPALRL